MALLIGYARCSTDQQDLTAQHDGLVSLGVAANRIYVDHGLTGTNRERPGLREALAACREGDTLVVTKLDRLARSLPDARAIADELTAGQVRLNLDGSVYDPTDVGPLLFNVLAMVAEFESDLIRLRTKEGMKVAKAKGVQTDDDVDLVTAGGQDDNQQVGCAARRRRATSTPSMSGRPRSSRTTFGGELRARVSGLP
jgi:DNA invertase Pin-like site-specific DNA recombinase